MALAPVARQVEHRVEVGAARIACARALSLVVHARVDPHRIVRREGGFAFVAHVRLVAVVLLEVGLQLRLGRGTPPAGAAPVQTQSRIAMLDRRLQAKFNTYLNFRHRCRSRVTALERMAPHCSHKSLLAFLQSSSLVSLSTPTSTSQSSAVSVRSRRRTFPRLPRFTPISFIICCASDELVTCNAKLFSVLSGGRGQKVALCHLFNGTIFATS